MVILIFFIAHWYVSAFSQSFFLHRYAAHGMFTMSKGWERFFYIFTFLVQGSTYFSPYGYGVMHRMHHAFADTEKDPHSPLFSKNVFDMKWKTYTCFNDILKRRVELEARFTRNVPDWFKFDIFADHIVTRTVWTLMYIGFYYYFATAWWQWLFLPITMFMSPIHGAIINWLAHKVGERRFAMSNTSTNLFPIDVFTMGESYHNNHHRFDSSPNFGVKWYEIDFTYVVIKILAKFKVIQLKPVLVPTQNANTLQGAHQH